MVSERVDHNLRLALTPAERIARMNRHDEYVVLWTDHNGYATVSKFGGPDGERHAVLRFLESRKEDPGARLYCAKAAFTDITDEVAHPDGKVPV